MTANSSMNGAETMRDALLDNGVSICFANPGTSEMHFVAALDHEPRMRCVLGLEENVVTGAADGYGRMTDRPAATLLHLGPGLANGLANLHNARRARTPIVNVVGDHASYHLGLDAPLTSDIESLAEPMSHFVRRITGADDVALATAQACAAARDLPGVATLILPADAAWNTVRPASRAAPGRTALRAVPESQVRAVAMRLRSAARLGQRIAFLVGGRALRARELEGVSRVAASLSARILTGPLSGRIERGAGRVAVEKIPYPIASALGLLQDVDLLVRIDAHEPVAFFAYPGAPGKLTRSDCEHVELATTGEDLLAAIGALAQELGVPATVRPLLQQPASEAPLPSGALTPEAVGCVVGRLVPEGAIVVDEALTAMQFVFSSTIGAAPHEYLQNTGGALGIGIPLAIGAAVACPARKVVTLQADGSGMYTIQGLWTQARERLNILTIVLANRSYAILHHEMRGVGVTELGENSRRMLNLDDPTLDFVRLAQGMGVEAARATNVAELADLMRAALVRPGPFLIEAVL